MNVAATPVGEGARATAADAGFGLYVHWPFCRSKCPYCDFNSHVRETIDEDRWRKALLVELDHFAARTGKRELTSIFLGGGTPSLMAPETVAAIIDRAADRWAPASDIEITLEANPTSVEAGKFAGFRLAGVNRVSLGVQALNDADLVLLGRQHSAVEAVAAVRLAQQYFPRVSFDLIYARSGQTPAAWRMELAEALELASEHLSLYQLTIEPETAFGAAWRRGELKVPDEDSAAALYEETQAILDAAGMPAYEISNHARSGRASRHNLTYWRYGDYVGIGPGAHGRVTLAGQRQATRQHRAPEAWLAAVERQGHATTRNDRVSPDEQRTEMTMMGLRLAEGISRARFMAVTGRTFETAFAAARLHRLVDGGFLLLDGEGLRATTTGRQRLNAVIAELLG